MKFLLMASALSLSSIAAYFSIIGLSAIFPGSIFSIVVMATALELAKIIVAVWVHQNWGFISRLTKFYLSLAVVILMFITSMGIFGFLSKSHIEHNASSTFATQEISEIDRKIKFENESIERYKKIIEEKKSSVFYSENKNEGIRNQLLKDIEFINSRSDQEILDLNNKIDKLRGRIRELDSEVAILRSQKGGFFSSIESKIKKLQDQQLEERTSINSQISKLDDLILKSRSNSKSESTLIRNKISSIQSEKVEISESDLSFLDTQELKIKNSLALINNLNNRKFELENKQLIIENELGPIKYISELIYDFGGPKFDSGTSVRLVIMLIIVVFDPLAIVMIICAFSIHINKRVESTSQTIDVAKKINNFFKKIKQKKDSENIQETESDSTPSVNLPSKTKPKSKYTVEIKKT